MTWRKSCNKLFLSLVVSDISAALFKTFHELQKEAEISLTREGCGIGSSKFIVCSLL